MYKLYLHANAASDLATLIRRGGPFAVAAKRVAVLIQELKGYRDLAATLLDHGLVTAAGLDVKKFVEQWRDGQDLWRLKHRDWSIGRASLRVIYAYVARTKTFHVLAVVARNEYNYEDDAALTRRLLADLEDLK